MPDTVSYRQLRSQIQTARELNRVVNQLRRGSRASAFDIYINDKGTVTTKWERREAQINFAVVERGKAVKRRRMGIQVDDIITPGHMGVMRENALLPSQTRPDDMTRRQMERLNEYAMKRTRENDASRAVSMYENYMLGMRNVGYGIADPDSYAEVRTIINEISQNAPEFLVDIFERNDERITIDWVYDDNADYDFRLRTIREAWEEYYAEYRDKYAPEG